MIAISRITRISLNRELRIENKLLNEKVEKMLVVKEEEEEPDGDMPAEEEGMLVTGEVIQVRLSLRYVANVSQLMRSPLRKSYPLEHWSMLS